MSKAFTREDDGAPDAGAPSPPIDEWPAGVPNYLTPAGHAALKERIDAQRAAAQVGDPHKRLLAEKRLAALLRRLEAAEVVDPATQPAGVVRFGATVTVADDDGGERRYRIVGVDEADPKRGWVSWRSPVAAALVGRRVGDRAVLRTPAGEQELTLLRIAYD